MITQREVVAGVLGAWRLAHFQADGLRFMDTTRAGALRSFWAAAIALPAVLPLMLLRLSYFPPRADEVQVALVEIIGYAISWAAFPVLAQVAARVVEREHFYPRMVAAYNWISLLQIYVLLVTAPLTLSGFLPSGLDTLVELVVRVALLAYLAFTIRTALDIGWPAAIGLAVVEFLLGLSVFRTMVTLEDGWPLPPGAA
jgi:hypothetical protein